MNFLAHLYLSGQDPEITVGNFFGDFIKGNQLEALPPQVQKGVRLHRAIDMFMDSHPLTIQGKQRLYGKYRHYAGVIIDMYYDHLLASNWDQYHDVPLKKYSEDFYLLADAYKEILPEKALNLLKYMSRGNWLYHYQYMDGLHQALSGLARRTKFVSHMEQASEELKIHLEAFEGEFHTYFPEVISHAKSFLSDYETD